MPLSGKRIRVALAQTAENQLSALFQAAAQLTDMEILQMTAPLDTVWKNVMTRSPDITVIFFPVFGDEERRCVGRILTGCHTHVFLLLRKPLPVNHGLDPERLDTYMVYSDLPDSRAAVDGAISRLRMLGGRLRGATDRKEPEAPPVRFNVQRPAREPRAAKISTEGADPRFAGMVIAIGASTGGTEALAAVFRMLPAKALPGIVVVQHMPPVFTGMYAQRLNDELPFYVSEATDNEPVVPGTIHIAPGGRQMRIKKRGTGYVTELGNAEKVSGHCPSVDVLFDSVAKEAGRAAAGIILTGMGADGAIGLLAMRQAGAFTIGQDEESCVVYGMPRKAFENGGVARQAALTDIPGVLTAFLGR